MTESEFQHNVAGANSLRSFSDLPDVDFWDGYARGIRRNYHGENFGTDDEHRLWLSLANETGDDQRRFRGIGYQAGFDGLTISEAIKHLQGVVAKHLAASAAGSVRSAAKTAANRENAKRPRPNAQGKPKPRKPKTE